MTIWTPPSVSVVFWRRKWGRTSPCRFTRTTLTRRTPPPAQRRPPWGLSFPSQTPPGSRAALTDLWVETETAGQALVTWALDYWYWHFSTSTAGQWDQLQSRGRGGGDILLQPGLPDRRHLGAPHLRPHLLPAGPHTVPCPAGQWELRHEPPVQQAGQSAGRGLLQWAGLLLGPQDLQPFSHLQLRSSLLGPHGARPLPGVDLQQDRDGGDDHQRGRLCQVVGREEVGGPDLPVAAAGHG